MICHSVPMIPRTAIRARSVATRAIALRAPVILKTTPGGCWDASFKMLRQYHGLPDTVILPHYIESSLPREKVPEFAQLAGLRAIGYIGRSNFLTGEQLEEYIREHGPLWCALQNAAYFDAGYHAVVITGVNRDIVFINDPDEGRIRRSIKWLNKSMDKDSQYCLMYQPR